MKIEITFELNSIDPPLVLGLELPEDTVMPVEDTLQKVVYLLYPNFGRCPRITKIRRTP